MFVLAGAAGIGEFVLAAIDIMRHVGSLGMWELYSGPSWSFHGTVGAWGWTGQEQICQL